jgi:hypothetical protein
MRRQCVAILVSGLGGLALFATAILIGPKELAAPGSVIAGLAGGWSMLRCQSTGLIRTRRGFVRRRQHPGLFRFHLCCGWTALVLWTLVGVLLGLGVLSSP